MRRRRRRGFALFVSILAIVILGALIVAVHVSVGLDRTLAEGARDRQRAYSAVEHALWSEVAAWDSSYDALVPGSFRAKVVRAAGDSAVITVVRLDGSLFWLKAMAAAGPPRRAAIRASGLSVRVSRDSSGFFIARPLPRYGWVGLR